MQNGHLECGRLLIANGAIVDSLDTLVGTTPLMVAMLEGHKDCGELLIENGANINATTTDNTEVRFQTF